MSDTPSTPPGQPPSLRRFWTVFFGTGLCAALVLRWRGLPLVLIPETAAALAFVACGVVEWVTPKKG